MTKYANDHPFKLVVGESDGIYANDHPYKVEIEGGVVTPEEFEELEKKVDALATDLSYKGGVPTYDDLPDDPEQGDVYTVEDTGVLYVWDGDEWVALNETQEPYKTLTTADYNYPTTGTKTSFNYRSADNGWYQVGGTENFLLSAGGSTAQTYSPGAVFYIYGAGQAGKGIMVFGGQNALASSAKNLLPTYLLTGDYIRNDLTTAIYEGGVLGAYQGHILNDRIGNLSTLTTTAKTSAVAAINELDSDKEGKTITGSAAPTTATVADNIGQKYYDSTNDKWYVCKAIEEESGGGFSYIWEEQTGGPNVVQTTGTSTTDVMSQKATSNMVYPSGYETSKTRINIGSVQTGSHADSVFIGALMPSGQRPESVAIAGNLNGASKSVVIGSDAFSNAQSAIALGYGARAVTKGQFDVSTGINHPTGGYNNSNYRLLTGLYDPQSAHDAANKQYVDANSATTLTNSQFNSILENA